MILLKYGFGFLYQRNGFQKDNENLHNKLATAGSF